MKSFKQYLAEVEMLSRVFEDSNLPAANDSTSPISGKNIDYKFAKESRRKTQIKPNAKTVQVHNKPNSPIRNS
jgi:hypothetical protein